MMKKISLLLLPFLALAACTPAIPNDASASSSTASSTAAWKNYRNITASFGISYPPDWTIKEIDPVITDDYELTGVSFVAPADPVSTTLHTAKLNIAKTDACPGLAEPRIGMFDDYPLKHVNWNSAGAGNLYEGETYTIEANSSCYVITFYTHSCNLGPDCGPENPQPYNKGELFNTFMRMLETFKVL